MVLIDPGQRGEIAGLKEIGFDAYLVRPVRPASLFAQLSEGEMKRGNTSPDEGSAIQSERAEAENAAAVRRVLLAEDNDINALLAQKMLEREGFEVIHAKNGLEAVRAARAAWSARAGNFDLILMDIHMPEVDGLDATRQIIELYDGAAAGKGRPPIIALTANAFPEDREQYLNAGLDDYLAKPFEREELGALLQKWTESPIGQVKQGQHAIGGGATCA